jgi:hypothetical protein
MNPYRSLLALVAVALLGLGTATAQSYTMGTATITTCSGALHDSGGPGGAGYGNNENLTSTICPAESGTSLSLNFVVFNLSTAGSAPADRLAIYDGSSTNATFLGEYSAQELQGLVITASALNPSGCLTLVFTSNETGTGTFAASIACGLPCAQPLASFTTALADTIRLCQGQQLFVDASTSQPAPDRTIAGYEWSASGAPVVSDTVALDTLTFLNGGAYNLRLRVIDDLGCASEPTEPVLLLVANTPTFLGTSAPELVCVPATFSLFGQAEAVPLNYVQGSCLDLGTGGFIPDDIGTLIEFVVPYNNGLPGEVIGSTEDLGDICMTMEHSFMGDLVIELECPNGQITVLHQQGGGSTFLGEATDLDSNENPELGICWTYCFSAEPDFGTWADCSINGPTPNVMPIGDYEALIPGTYTPVEPLSNLVGCPVNGDWTLRFVDLFGADNGFLCSWCTGFALGTDSINVALTPGISLAHPDSAFWSGPEVGNLPDSPDGTATLTSAVYQPYTFSVIDAFGCQHDTTLVVQAIEPLLVNAGDDVLLCADSVQLGVSVFPDLAISCTYTLLLFDSFGDGWGSAFLNVVLDGATTMYGLTGSSADTILLDVQDGMELTLTYTAGGMFNNENRFELFNDQGDLVFDSGSGPDTGELYSGSVDCFGPDLSEQTQWAPSTGLSDPGSQNPMLFTTTSGWYTVTVAPADLPACFGTDSIWVETAAQPIELIWNDTDSILCASNDTLASYAWWLNGELYTTTTIPCLDNIEEGSWAVIGSGTSECPYVSEALLVCPVVTLVQDAGFVIGQGAVGTWVWTVNGAVIPGAQGPFVQLQGNGTYVGTVTTAQGCVVSDEILIDGITGVTEHEGNSGLLVFPVPNEGRFTVVASGLQGSTAMLRLCDLSGRVVHHEQLGLSGDRVNLTLDLTLPAGSYVLQVQDGSGQRMARVVVE